MGESLYMILGCGDVGFSVASMLKERGADVAVVDRDVKTVERLGKMGYQAYLGDFGVSDVLKGAGFEKAEMILVLLRNFDSTQTALGSINKLREELKVDPVVVVRVSDEAEVMEAKRLGASDALPTYQLLARFAVGKLEELKMMAKEKKLRALLQREASRRKMAIVLQTNPDPDSIASGVALKLYAKGFGFDADLIYDGIVGHPQNKALLNLLGVQLYEANRVNFRDYEMFALVDVATHAYCSLPADIMPTIVIDHHTVPAGDVKAVFYDITPVGAASTLLTNYLKYGAIEVDRATATALAVGILTDTLYFTRGVTPLDLEAFEFLTTLADKDILRTLFSPIFTADALDIMVRSVKAAKINGNYLTSYVGDVKDRDLIALAADFLLNREGVSTSLIYGVVEDNVYVSARTKDVTAHIGQTLKKAYSQMGSAGGHPSMAGATIPLSFFKVPREKLKKEVDRAVRVKFLEAVGVLKPKKPRKPKKK
jgi:nanoRNase/pAp phosphatase (c-di-AMP/oligoRNAs hydrolase)/predicted dinucleotide-binding enzyme